MLQTVKLLWDAFKRPFEDIKEARLFGLKGENARLEELLGVHTLVERFDIEPFSDLSAK